MTDEPTIAELCHGLWIIPKCPECGLAIHLNYVDGFEGKDWKGFLLPNHPDKSRPYLMCIASGTFPWS